MRSVAVACAALFVCVSVQASPPWGTLEQELHGSLVLPNASVYSNSSMQWNTRFLLHPAAVVYCADADDVATAMSFARAQNIVFSLRSGGHNTEGWAVCSGCIVIDVSKLKDITVDSEFGIVTAGMGMTLYEYDMATVDAEGLMSPTGLCPSVGLAGYAQGGGIGWTSRSQGLFIDRIVRYRVVLANGTALTVGVSESVPNSQLRGMLPLDGSAQPNVLHPELFWALRGGGGGNFVAVTEATMVLDPAPKSLLYAEFTFDVSLAHNVTRQFFASNNSHFEFFLLFVAPQPGTVELLMQGIWSGDYDDGVTALKGFHELPGTVAKYYDLSYSAAKERFSSGGISVPIAGKQKSAFVPASAVEGFLLPNGGVDTIIDALKVINPAAGGHSAVYMNHVGGAVNAPAPSDTAFAHRTYLANFVIDMHWELDANVTQESVAWARSLYGNLSPLLAPAVYYNYLDRDLCDSAYNPLKQPWEQLYWGGNVDRLLAVKAMYDPEGIFTTWPQALNGSCDVV